MTQNIINLASRFGNVDALTDLAADAETLQTVANIVDAIYVVTDYDRLWEKVEDENFHPDYRRDVRSMITEIDSVVANIWHDYDERCK